MSVAGFLCFLVFEGAVAVYSTSICYKHLRTNNHVLSARTARLFRSLINLLVVDVTFAMCTCWIGVICILFSFYYQLERSAEVFVVALAFLHGYPLFNEILIVLFVKDYRVEFLRLLHLQRWTGNSKKNDTQWAELVYVSLFSCFHPSFAFRSVSRAAVQFNSQRPFASTRKY